MQQASIIKQQQDKETKTTFRPMSGLGDIGLTILCVVFGTLDVIFASCSLDLFGYVVVVVVVGFPDVYVFKLLHCMFKRVPGNN